MKDFYIDPVHLTSITEVTKHSMYSHKKELTHTELLKVLKDEDTVTSISNIDHPEFTKLRLQLEELGYVQIQRQWWNGDRVVKPFALNGVKFKKDDQFCSASAMGHHLNFSKSYRKKKNLP